MYSIYQRLTSSEIKTSFYEKKYFSATLHGRYHIRRPIRQIRITVQAQMISEPWGQTIGTVPEQYFNAMTKTKKNIESSIGRNLSYFWKKYDKHWNWETTNFIRSSKISGGNCWQMEYLHAKTDSNEINTPFLQHLGTRALL